MIPLIDNHPACRRGSVPARGRLGALLLALFISVGIFSHHGALAAEATPKELEQAKRVLAERMRQPRLSDADPEVTGSVGRGTPPVSNDALSRLFAPQPLGPESRFVPGPIGSMPDQP
jgi:hypothetical protein